jgi:hypothetical protein
MSKLIINDNGIDREATSDEVAYINESQTAAQADTAARKAQADAKAVALASARAKLADLGLTEAEVKALVG